jgi:hypothetical protein
MTLWMNGKPVESEVAGRTETRAAYDAIVVDHPYRDPSLLSTCGPDSVLLQCYPVPANQTLKVRIGFTAPWSATDPGRGRLWLPFIKERNFGFDENFHHDVQIQGGLDVALSNQELTRHSPITVQGPTQVETYRQPRKLLLVVDGSASMADQASTIEEFLRPPRCLAPSLWPVMSCPTVRP